MDGKALAIAPDDMTTLQDTARKLGLTQEQFQGMTALGAQRIADLAAAPLKAWNDQQAAWQTSIKADPDIGGDKLPAALGHAAGALDAFGGAELREALNVTGAGNHPAIVRAFVSIGRALADPSKAVFGKPAGAAGKQADPETHARGFYNSVGGNYPAQE